MCVPSDRETSVAGAPTVLPPSPPFKPNSPNPRSISSLIRRIGVEGPIRNKSPGASIMAAGKMPARALLPCCGASADPCACCSCASCFAIQSPFLFGGLPFFFRLNLQVPCQESFDSLICFRWRFPSCHLNRERQLLEPPVYPQT